MRLSEDDFWKPVITTVAIIEGRMPVRIIHLDEEGDWEAYSAEEDIDGDDLDVVSVEEMMQIDPSLKDLPDIEKGQFFYREEMNQ